MDEQDRNKLIMDNIALVGYVISRLNIDFPQGMTEDDIFQEGCIGLIMAADRYSPDKGSFSNYACIRIRGAILDGIARYQWMEKKTAARKKNPRTQLLELMPEYRIGEPSAMEKEEMAISFFELAEEQILLGCAMDHLDPVEKRLIRDHYYDERPFLKIAKARRMNYYSVRLFHASALQKLQMQMK